MPFKSLTRPIEIGAATALIALATIAVMSFFIPSENEGVYEVIEFDISDVNPSQ